MPQQHRTFAREEVYPSYIVNLVFSALSTFAEQFKIEKVNDTTIRVPASAGDGLAAIAIDGNLRFRESTVQAAHPGGATGTYDIYVTASANDIDISPLPNTDNTDYNFGLVIVAGGATPTIAPGTVDHHRKVGELQWDGAAITSIEQQVDVPDLSWVAPLASPVFTGDPRAPTPAAGDDDTSIATTEWVRDRVAGVQVTLDSQGGLDVATNNATERTLYEFSIPGGTLTAGRMLELFVAGRYRNESGGSRTLRVRAYIDDTLVFDDVTQAFNVMVGEKLLELQLRVYAQGAADQIASGSLELSPDTSTTTGRGDFGRSTVGISSDDFWRQLFGGDAAEDMSTAKTLKITVQHPVADPNLSLLRDFATLKA